MKVLEPDVIIAPEKGAQPSIVSFIFDLPNICTLCGLLSSFLGVYYAIQGNVYFAVIGGVWAVLFDWLDGLIASKMRGRTENDKAFGGQLDSLSDMVSFGVLPAIILLSYTDYNFWSLLVGFFIVGGCAIRLSYFNIYGLTGGKTYTGLAVDFNGLIVSLAFLIEGFLDKSSFSIGLTILLLIVSILNLATVQIPKLSKKWLFGIAAYVIGVTIYLGRLQLLGN